MIVRVSLTPPAPGAAGGPGWTGVAIDVLRATTTLTVALSNGAAGVVPYGDTAEALRHRERDPRALVCGEREGRIVAGFDRGNSPFEFGREVVEGRTLAFASTNGSRALLALERCDARWLGAFVNASALLRAVRGAAKLHVVCAGKLGRFALEDAAFAGWLCASLAREGATLDGGAARLVSRLAPANAEEARARVEGASHARYLGALGPEFARDVAFCATMDAVRDAFRV